MESIQSASYYARKIAIESRHKFIYSYKENRKLLTEQFENYSITLGNTPAILYLKLEGLPKIEAKSTDLNKATVSIMSDQYISFLIASELLQSVLSNNDIDALKPEENKVLKYINCMSKEKFKDLYVVSNLLQEVRDMYLDMYLKCAKHGILEDPTKKYPFAFIELEDFVQSIKKVLEKKNHISIVLDHREEMPLEFYKAINNLISSRINGDISVNVLTTPDNWKSYIDQRNQLIEAIHDYENVEYDNSSSEYLKKIKRRYHNNY